MRAVLGQVGANALTSSAVDYVERNEQGTLRVTGTRVSLASVVHAYWNGDSPEDVRPDD